MNEPTRSLRTPRGSITFPAYVSVTTFGSRYPLDQLIRPYLPRLAQAVMVSFHYAQEMEEKLSIPVMIDSGGLGAFPICLKLSGAALAADLPVMLKHLVKSPVVDSTSNSQHGIAIFLDPPGS